MKEHQTTLMAESGPARTKQTDGTGVPWALHEVMLKLLQNSCPSSLHPELASFSLIFSFSTERLCVLHIHKPTRAHLHVQVWSTYPPGGIRSLFPLAEKNNKQHDHHYVCTALTVTHTTQTIFQCRDSMIKKGVKILESDRYG